MKNIAFFTIVARNYIPYAITLAKSIHAHYPSVKVYIAIADVFNKKDKESFSSNVELIDIELLELPQKHCFYFRYDVMELSTAIKPYVFKYIFENSNVDNIVYLDPDIFLVSLLEELFEMLGSHGDIILTPHLLSPMSDDKHPSELQIMKAGAYNLGFIAIAKSNNSDSFIKWWCQKLEKGCVNELENGLFTDQKWIDLAPSLFDRVSLLRLPSYNLAYWNLAQRRVSKSIDGQIEVDNHPLRFVHFSGVDLNSPERFSKHQNRFTSQNIGELKSLYEQYLSELKESGYFEFIGIQNGFDSFNSGERINKAMRVYFRRYLDDGKIQFPFDKLSQQFFTEIDSQADDTIITRYLRGLYDAHPALQKYFSINGLDNQIIFLEYMNRIGYLDYKVPKELRAPQRLLKISTLVKGGNLYQVKYSLPLKRVRAKISTFLYDLYSSNKKTYLLVKFLIPDSITNYIIINSDYHNPNIRPATIKGKTNIKVNNSAIKSWLTKIYTIFKYRNVDFSGVSLIGYAKGDFGVAQNLRSIAGALESVESDFSIYSLSASNTHSETDNSYEKYVSSSLDYGVRLMCVNADQTVLVRDDLSKRLSSARKGFYIGNWFWELPAFPDEWRSALDVVDEIWAPSKYIETALKSWTDKKITYMPVSVEFQVDSKYDRSYFQIPKDKFCFLFSYDLYSFSSRKNPQAVLDAFLQAFPPGDDRVKLIIKVNHADKNPGDYEVLVDKLQSDSRIMLISKVLLRDEMYGLLNSCDCYVSLHRAEGFGLGLAESMFLGKPVIGTGYSGNMDFMNAENSYLVDYQLIPVPENAYPYWRNQEWAEPSIESAAKGMKKIFDDPSFRSRISEIGKLTIMKNHSFSAVGTLINRRLNEIRKMH